MAVSITIKEIAKKAGVSIGTVDRVLHNRGRVAEATKSNVLKIAEEGNYSSNIYARNLKLNKTYSIAVVLPPENFYWKKQKEGIKQGIAAYESMGFTQKEYILQETDDQALADAIELVLAAKPDGIIISPGFFHQDSRALDALKISKIPYVFVDSNIANGGNLTFIGQDSFKSGQVAAGLLDKGFCNPYELFIITFSRIDLVQKTILSRIKGLRHYYTQNSNAAINIHEINLEQDNTTIVQLMDMLTAIKKPIHLFVPNSSSHLLGLALLPLRKQLKLRFVGYDLLGVNEKLLKNGVLDYIIHQNPQMQGKLAVQALYQHLVLVKEVELNQYLPLDIITKENLEYANG